MSRGFFVGAGWGTVVAGLGLVVASQLTVSPQGQDGLEPPAAVVASAPAAEVQTETALSGGEAKLQPEAPDDAASELAVVMPDAAVEPILPAAGGDVALASAPDALPEETLAPGPTADAVVETDSPKLPEVQTVMAQPDTGTDAGTSPVVPAMGDTIAANGARAVEPLPDASAPDAPPAAAEVVPDATADAATDGVAVDPASLPDVVVVVPDAPASDGTAAMDTPSADNASQDTPILRPATGFGNKVDGVKTGRLPSITAAATAEGTQTQGGQAVDPATVGLSDGAGLPPVERYARPFENADKKPLFAIVLQDTGGPDVDREALAAIPFPVSFMIDPLLPDAATAAQIYRAAGQEVVMIASGLPTGAQASDLAVSFEVMAKALPEAVAVVDLEQGGFQGNRTLATQVLALVKDQGRGVLSWDRGLNAASQVARRDGVPSALIFRSLDGGNEGSPIIRRYLDRAAFKAAQDGRVVVAGQTRPETVAALLEWAVEGRAATVALAPATAVMTSQ
ncbi:divergent polysaccharide deacetylase family protein [Pseudorhodobacter ferrugineus]|uniref:divergent polysaccharide deacetylase family protein n=1 Tax=Pseudorhodobacter ferrugineus TaxID=77008 RepID=UPI00048FFC8E|nr:divergent polysaccharide deacetylase family protein [Pseudorhodobacter ferrugineus]